MEAWLRIWLLLILATIGACGMVVYRVIYTGNLAYSFMIWNVFLAWVPVLCTWLALRLSDKLGQKNIMSSLFSLLWLLFLPNAPYLFTDLIHFNYFSHPLSEWYDLVMLLFFSL